MELAAAAALVGGGNLRASARLTLANFNLIASSGARGGEEGEGEERVGEENEVMFLR